LLVSHSGSIHHAVVAAFDVGVDFIARNKHIRMAASINIGAARWEPLAYDLSPIVNIGRVRDGEAVVRGNECIEVN
jgi:hypothetical protein